MASLGQWGITPAISTALPTAADLSVEADLVSTLKDSNVFEGTMETDRRTAALGLIQRAVLEFVKVVSRKKSLSAHAAEAAEGRVLVAGSHRLGVHTAGSDTDALVIVPRHVMIDDFVSEFPPVFQKATPQGVIEYLTKNSDGYVPSMKLKITGIGINLFFSRLNVQLLPSNLNLEHDDYLRGLGKHEIHALSTVRVPDSILKLVPQQKTFQVALRVIKLWAECRALYSAVIGFPSDIGWAILIARVCQLYPRATSSLIIAKFFAIFNKWDWPRPVLLKPIEDGHLQLKVWNPKIYQEDLVDLMPIITPAYPSICVSKGISMSTRAVILREMERGSDIAEKNLLKQLPCNALFARHSFFTRDYKNYLCVTSSSQTKAADLACSRVVESKLQLLVRSLDEESHIMVACPFPKGFKRVHKVSSNQEAKAVEDGSTEHQEQHTQTPTIDEPKESTQNVRRSSEPESSEASGLDKTANGEIWTIYTSTYYIGLEIGPFDPGVSRSLNISMSAHNFRFECTSAPKYQPDSNGLSIVHVRNYNLPDDVFQPGETKPTRSKKKTDRKEPNPPARVKRTFESHEVDQVEESAHDFERSEDGPPTDSGYASATYGKQKQGVVAEDHAETQQDIVSSLADNDSAFIKSETSETPFDPEEPDSDDTRTIYSSASSVPSLIRDSYISELSDHLIENTIQGQPDNQAISRALSILPELLRAFALKVGHMAPSQMHRDIMVFVHKNRSHISEEFEQRCSHEEESFPKTQAIDDKMSLSEIMDFWNKTDPDKYTQDTQGDFFTDEMLDLDISEEVLAEMTDEHEETNMPSLLAYREFILNSPAYQWLVETLRRELLLAPAEPDKMGNIRRKIVKAMPSSHRLSRKSNAENYTVIYRVLWNPLGFIEEQGYKEDPHETVEKAITLTGTAEDGQALTCAQYLSQTWPSTGKHIIQLVKNVVRAGPNSRQICEFPDKTRVTAQMNEDNFVVEAFGTADSVAEVGEQFAWLGAALRSSPYSDGVAYCVPSISEIKIDSNQQRVLGTPSHPRLLCRIDFTFEERGSTPLVSNGRCWHDLFRNPVVVTGYPILRRPVMKNTGLEIPLNMMAGLVRNQYVSSFHDKLFIKAFSTLLIPTVQMGKILIWHLIRNADSTRISYLQNSIPHVEDISIFDLESSRHVLGWCSNVKYIAGAADADYLIKPSRLPRPDEGCALSEVSVFKRQIITGGSPFSIGYKDTPIHISRDGYIPKLKWLQKKVVVLWDESDKRGWLVNGTSVLLHLLRASLKQDSMDEINSEFLFKPGDIQEAPQKYRPHSAIKVLGNTHNLKLPIYPEKGGFLHVEDRVDQLCDILERIMDYEVGISTHNSPNLYRPRRNLEGWDFNDLASSRDIIYPRLSTLHADGKGWVDFTRTLHAITLFGRKFGEIFQPEHSSPCAKWSKLPKEKYYLAASIYDLKKIMDVDGDLEANPMKLAHNIIWYNPHKDFGSCECMGKGSGKHSNFAQVLLPSVFHKKVVNNNNNPVPLEDCGSVIFGHNENAEWSWNDVGDPEEGKPQLSSADSETEFHDSEIGSYSSSSATKLSKASESVTSHEPSVQRKETISREQYTVGIVCALNEELLAVRILFDSRHEKLETDLRDINNYSLGRIGRHNVVAACLPSGEMGTNAAAAVVSHLTRSFPAVQFCLLVGIGGGVPSRQNDIRLGDVVVSHPTKAHPGVIQYDLGKALDNNEFERTGTLQRPPQFLMTAISSLMSDPDGSSTPIQRYLDDIAAQDPKYKHPGVKHDMLFWAKSKHRHGETCAGCKGWRKRKRRPGPQPRIHYGLIASGNQVMKNAKTRESWGTKYNILCFEMEAAGIMNIIPSLVIRGICDYADSHKNDMWHKYAAATAAAYAKVLLSVV